MLKENQVRIVLIAGVVVGVVAAMAATGAVSASVGQGDNYGPAISYIAFCAEDGVDQGDLTLTVMEDEDGEVGAVDYSSDVGLDTIRYKAGQGKYDISNADQSGTVTSGDGTSASFSNGSPCPSEQSGVKFGNYDSNTDKFTQVEEV